MCACVCVQREANRGLGKGLRGRGTCRQGAGSGDVGAAVDVVQAPSHVGAAWSRGGGQAADGGSLSLLCTLAGEDRGGRARRVAGREDGRLSWSKNVSRRRRTAGGGGACRG